jgi:hypothetical protein
VTDRDRESIVSAARWIGKAEISANVWRWRQLQAAPDDARLDDF